MFITEWLARKGLNQREGAKLLGIDEGRFSRYCTRKALPSIPTAVRIARDTNNEVDVGSWMPAAPGSTAESDTPPTPRER